MIDRTAAGSMPIANSAFFSRAGCVAVQSTTLQPYRSTSSRSAASVAFRKSTGMVCASSRMMTLRASRCSLRQGDVAEAKRLS